MKQQIYCPNCGHRIERKVKVRNHQERCNFIAKLVMNLTEEDFCQLVDTIKVIEELHPPGSGLPPLFVDNPIKKEWRKKW